MLQIITETYQTRISSYSVADWILNFNNLGLEITKRIKQITNSKQITNLIHIEGLEPELAMSEKTLLRKSRFKVCSLEFYS